MSEITIWSYINMLSTSKKMPEFDEHFEKVYSPYLVNRYFSLIPDNSIIIANAINKNWNMSKVNHFLFLHGMIRKGKRKNPGKWPKAIKDARINFIMEEFNYSRKRAQEASLLITDEQLNEMQKAKEQGGAF